MRKSRLDAAAQIIVAASLMQAANDKQQLVPMLEAAKLNVGRLPEKTTADAGYFSAAPRHSVIRTSYPNSARFRLDLVPTMRIILKKSEETQAIS